MQGAIRTYFLNEGLLEVTTPVLRSSGAVEVHLENLVVETSHGESYLQTSPEYAMKCLIAKYQTSLFQLCPAFRDGESGKRHRIEFQMLEWYRCNFNLQQLGEDVGLLFKTVSASLAGKYQVADAQSLHRTSYLELFEGEFSINPHTASGESLRSLALKKGLEHLSVDAVRADYLDGLFSLVEPQLQNPTLVFEYPACQAALAELKRNEQGDLVADRFEFFCSGMELANAYQELIDPVELRDRFDENNRLRKDSGKPVIPMDEELLESIGSMPITAGIALGTDRLAMVLLGVSDISDIMP